MTSFIHNIDSFTDKPIVSTAVQRAGSKRIFGKVAVLLGGQSAERAISLQTGQNILESLQRQGVDAHPIDPGDNLYQMMQEGQFDRAFIALHGRGGEDGGIQGFLETLKIPYTGSRVAASALAMDKARAKLVMNALEVPTPPFGIAKTLEQAKALVEKIDFPVSVKPVSEGSSIGVTRVASLVALPEAFAKAAQYGDVIIEKWIDGKDFTVSILGDRVLPSLEVHTPSAFYDYEAKYESNATQYLCPAPLAWEEEKALRAIAYRAYCALGCEGWGRVDLVRDSAGKFWVLEVNTVPGMTSHSLMPLSAKAAGISFDELVIEILAMTLEEQIVSEKVSKIS